MKDNQTKHILGGLFIALIIIRFFHLATTPISVQLFALFLAYTSCFYFGSALSDMSSFVIPLELFMSLIFFSFASLGLIVSSVWLVGGYTLHGVWDMLHHTSKVKTKVIKWFPPMCATVDFLVAGYININY